MARTASPPLVARPGRRYDRRLQLPSIALSDLAFAAAYAIFLGSYVVFALGKFPGMRIDRPGAAVIGAVLWSAMFPR